MKTIKLPCYGIVVKCDPEKGTGTIKSTMTTGVVYDEDAGILEAAVNTIEAMVLAHACAGVDIEDPSYIEGIETAVEKIHNEYA
jgi:hypothetical protein